MSRDTQRAVRNKRKIDEVYELKTTASSADSDDDNNNDDGTKPLDVVANERVEAAVKRARTDMQRFASADGPFAKHAAWPGSSRSPSNVVKQQAVLAPLLHDSLTVRDDDIRAAEDIRDDIIAIAARAKHMAEVYTKHAQALRKLQTIEKLVLMEDHKTLDLTVTVVQYALARGKHDLVRELIHNALREQYNELVYIRDVLVYTLETENKVTREPLAGELFGRVVRERSGLYDEFYDTMLDVVNEDAIGSQSHCNYALILFVVEAARSGFVKEAIELFDSLYKRPQWREDDDGTDNDRCGRFPRIEDAIEWIQRIDRGKLMPFSPMGMTRDHQKRLLLLAADCGATEYVLFGLKEPEHMYRDIDKYAAHVPLRLYPIVKLNGSGKLSGDQYKRLAWHMHLVCQRKHHSIFSGLQPLVARAPEFLFMIVWYIADDVVYRGINDTYHFLRVTTYATTAWIHRHSKLPLLDTTADVPRPGVGSRSGRGNGSGSGSGRKEVKENKTSIRREAPVLLYDDLRDPRRCNSTDALLCVAQAVDRAMKDGIMFVKPWIEQAFPAAPAPLIRIVCEYLWWWSPETFEREVFRTERNADNITAAITASLAADGHRGEGGDDDGRVVLLPSGGSMAPWAPQVDEE